MDTQDTVMLTAEAIEFGEWLSRVAVPGLLRERRLSERRARAATLRLIMDVEDVVVASADYTAAAEDEVSLKSGDIVEVLDTKSGLGSKPAVDATLDVDAQLLDTSAARHKLACRPKKKYPKGKGKKIGERWLVRVIDDVQGGELRTRQGFVPAGILQEKQSLERDQTSLAARRQAVVRELVETEEEFGRDMQQVVSRYMRPMDKATTPKQVFDNRELLFSNFKQICEFHNTVLLEGIKYYAGEPKMLGRALLRMEREFDKHVAYCRDEPRAQHLLREPPVQKYFQALADKLGDDKGIAEHLKLPIQRINDYQLLLKELVKYSNRLNEDCTDLQKALELFLGVPNRATDNKFISSIEGFRGNIHKLGRLLTHDWFTVTDSNSKAKERYLFLFKARILVSKVKRVSDDRSVFVLKDIIRLPEVEIKDSEEPLKFDLHLKDSSSVITLAAHKEQVKTTWLTEIRKYASDVVALAEHAADDLQVEETEPEEKDTEPKEAVEPKEKAAEPKEKAAEPKRKAELEPEEQAPAKKAAAEDQPTATVTQGKAAVPKEKAAEPKEKAAESNEKAGESKKREHTEESQAEVKEEVKEKRSRVDEVEEVILTREESLQQLKTKRKASIESGSATKVSKSEVVEILSISENQEPSAVGVESSEVTADLATKSSVSLSSKVGSKSVTSQSISQETVKAANTPKFKSTTAQVEASVVEEKAQTVAKTTEGVREEQSSGVVSEAVVESNQTVTAEEAEEMSRYNRSSRLSGEYSSSSRKLSSGGRYESSSTYDSTGLSSTTRRESGSKIESGRYETGGSIEGSASTRYESRYSTSSRTEGGSKYGAESSFESKTEGSGYAIESDTTSKLDSIAAKYGIDTKKEESKTDGSAYSVEYDSTSASKIDSIASKYGKGSYVSESVEGRSSKISTETSLEGSKVEGASSITQSSYESSKNGSTYETATSKTAIANGSVSTDYQSTKSVSKSVSHDGKPIFTTTLEGATIEPGENAVFECKLKDSSEAVKVTWLKDNKPLTDRLMDRCSISGTETDHKLQLMHCREDDSGVYTAVAENVKGNAHCTAQLVVYELTSEERKQRNDLNAPYFLVALKDTEIMENTYLRFMIRVKGEPNPDVTFYRDEKEIVSTSQSDRISIIRTRADKGCYELVIPDVTPADAGNYSCKATNIYGEVTTEAKVTVVDDKNIFFELPPGGEGLLAKGEKPTFAWKRDGQAFDPEERFKVLLGDDEDSLALVFQHVKPEDAGLYTCVAKTSTGNISCSAELTVQGAINELHREPEKPTLVIEHRDAIVSAGASAMLELQCKGFPKPSIVFKHDGKLIEPDTRHKFLYEDEESMSLVIKNVTAADAGEYHVIASNELGEDTTTMKLIVKQPPKIKKIENQTCMAGSTHTVTIEVEGTPAPDLTFYKDGVEIKSSERIQILKETDYIYKIIIKETKITDTGSYSVVAKNEVNQCSDYWQWQVTSPPRVIKTMGESKVCSEKDVVTFNVETESDPAPNVKWFKNKTEISSSSSYKMSSSGSAHSLVITSAARADAGEYSCEIRNIHGSVSDSCLLNVRCGPVFTQRLQDTTAAAGDVNVELTVDVEAYPQPNVKWFLGDVEITEKKSVYTRIDSGNTHKIILKEVSAELAGQYTCKVSNDLGSDSCQATFTVNRKPRITKSLVDMTVDAGKTLKLDVEVEGCPEPKVKWFKDGKEVFTDARIKIERDTQRLENYHLTVTLVKEEDGGEYEVKAENEFGSVSSKSTVTVHAKEVHSRITKQEIVENEIEEESKAKKQALEEDVDKTEKQNAKKDKTKAEVAEEKSFWDDDNDGKAEMADIKDADKLEAANATKSKSEPEVAEEKSFWDDEDGDKSKKKVKEVDAPKPSKGRKSISEPEKAEEKSYKGDDDGKTKKPVIEEPDTPKLKAQKSVTVPEEIEEKSFWGDQDDGKPKKPIIEEVQSPKMKSQKSVTIPEEIEEKSFWDDDDDVKSKKPVIGEAQAPKLKAQKSVTEPEIVEEKSFWDDDGNSKKPIIQEAEEPHEAKTRKSSLESEIIEEKSIWDENHNEQNKKPVIEEVFAEKKVGEKGATKPEMIEEVPVEENLKSKRKSIKKEPLEEPLSAGIEAPPTLGESTLKDGHAYESLPLVYTVIADGNPKPTVKWLHNGKEVKPCNRVHITNDGNLYKIEIDAVNMKDAGQWQCEINNDLGKNVLKAELSVSPESELRKPKFTTPLEAQRVLQREPVSMQAICTADPQPHVSWLLNGMELTPDINLEISAEEKDLDHGLKECTFKLHIPKGNHADTGEYTIKATNKYGVGECSARLDILLRPEIEGLKDVTAVPYEETSFIANVRANPIAEVKWSKDGYAIQPSSRFDIVEDLASETYKLIVKKVGVDDAGNYTLTAKNEVGETAQQVKLTVHTGEPIFTKPLVKETVKDYDDCTLKVRCDGVPAPDVTWYRDGQEIVNDERHTISTETKGAVDSALEIKHFEASDAGKYKVRALNIAGEATCEAVIAIAKATPGFTHKLDRSKEVDEGEPLELKAKVDGSPIPTAKWYKDGAPLPASDPRVKQTALPDGTVKLNIEHVTPADCGAYKLLITNPHGEHAALCAVAVNPTPRKPSFSQELVDVKAVVGQPLKLEARVMAFPAPEVKWFKDGLPVRPSQAVNFINSPGGLIGLQIENCKPEDAGTYLLTVTNKLGEAACKAHADVQQKERKPAFIAELQPAKVIEGFPAKLEVKILGHPKPTVKWTRNGEEIVPDGQRVKVVSQPDGTHALILSAATAADAGKYAVVAANDVGCETSTADLTVASRTDDANPQERPQLIHGLRDVTAEEGQPLCITAPILGNPVPDVTWTKDGLPLVPSDRVTLTCDGKRVGLEIRDVEMPDAGKYGVKLVNPLGEDASEGNINVRKIYQAPKFTQKFTDLQQLPTFDAKFPARVNGIPTPDITWYKNGTQLKHSDKYTLKRDGDACCLYVRDVKPDDAAKYKCVARNREGQAECEATLEVVDKIGKTQRVEPPSFLKKIGDIEVFRGMSAKFTACATGTPEPDVEWYRNGERLFPCERIRMDKETTGLLRLTISGIDPADVGTYQCRIYNPHGEETCGAELTYDTLEIQTSKRPISDQYSDFDKMKKTGIPMPLADRPIISRMADRHLTLSWKPSIPHGPRFPVTYQVEMCEQPDGDWFTARTGLRSCVCDIRNLEPFRDYKFRVRVENKYGVSDPSPFALTHRENINPDPPKFVPYLDPGIDFRPDTSPYFPRDFDIERPPHDGYAQAPRFLRQEYDSQYGVKGHNVNLFWFVYGYPKPKMTYFYNDEPIEIGGRYDWSYTRNGQATLFINKMLERDAGWYEAVATNEHGQARQRVRLELAEYPAFIRRPEEAVVLQRRTVRIEARLTGVPYPDIKWYKDWQPLAASARIKMSFVEPDLCILSIHDAILKDEGLYSISARNVAGAISSSAMLHVEESEHEYSNRIREHPPRVKPSTKPFGDFYDLGDELGRGVQGAVYHAAERLTGRNYAAKIMHGHSELKPFMKNELDILNILNDRHLIRLYDAYEHEHTLALVTELAAGGELVRDRLLRGAGYTEREIAGYMRQLLRGLKYMHDNNVAHLGLTIGELLLSHAGSDELKICDFGLSRRIHFNKHASLDYGMPEYVAPEVANGEGVSFATDMWSLGIITYILLSGHSPFRGVNDVETLDRVREGRWEWHDEVWWSRLSREGRDFISKLLVTSWHERMDVDAALNHPWLSLADKIYHEEYHITTDRLRNYYNLYKDWTGNAQCRTWFRRRPLSGAYTHPSKMVYPPGEIYTPEATPDRTFDRKPVDISFKQWDHPDWEVSAKSESHYQNGPDTYLLQLRDTQFPVRLREYMKVACGRSPAYNIAVHDLYDPRTPIIRERRRFTDIMDEEIDDEQRERINNYGTESYTIRRLRHELGTRLDSYAEAQAFMEAKKDGQLPFFREKPQVLPVVEGEPASLSCFAVGDPKPAVQWFKNDMVIAEGQRIKIIEDEEGRSTLRFEPAMHHDIGFYKVVARNKVGQTVARTRILEATNPDAPDSPTAVEISDSEVLLRWKQPKYDGNSPVVCYSLQYKEGDNVEWKTVADNIDHEFFVVRHLATDTSYQFRLSSRNRIGWSDKGIPTNLIKTLPAGAPKIEVTKAMKHLQQMTESGQEIVLEEDKPKLNYATEEQSIEWASTPLMDKYSFISELGRGRFSIVVKGVQLNSDSVVVAKILETRADTEVQVQREFECLRRLRHERIANLLAAYQLPGSGVSALIMEKLQGADILTYLSSRHEYSEQLVATVVTQLLDALQYVHWRGYCHLDLQPDNVVMSSVRSVQVKLVDFGSAHKVNKLGTVVPQVGDLEFKAPEIVNDEPAYPQSDIWSLGVLTYVLLSGTSPFRGVDDAQTKQNISFVRYRFEHLYKEITQEATRFLMFLFKRVPLKRPLAEECYEHRWLTQSDFMNRKRERALFLGNRLKEFSDEYHERKSLSASQADTAALAFGKTPRMLARSNSIQDELQTNFAGH